MNQVNAAPGRKAGRWPKIISLMICLFAFAASVGAQPAGNGGAANLVRNGSFEIGPAPGSYIVLGAGSTAVEGWTVTPGIIAYVGTYWVSSDGSRSIHLSSQGAQGAGIEQSLPTTPGRRYNVAFDFTGHPEGGPAIKQMRVTAAEDAAEFTFDVSGRRVSDPGWRKQSWIFTAKEGSTKLRFQNLNPSAWGPGIDNVVVTLASPDAQSVANAASYIQTTVTRDGMFSLFGTNLAASVVSATTLPLPFALEGRSITVIGSDGVERPAPLFFVSPQQMNFLLPPETPLGEAKIRVGSVGAGGSEVAVKVEPVAPGLFAANASGKDVAAALWLRIAADGSRVTGPVFRLDSQLNRFVPAPIDLGPAEDQGFLLLFGTGIRGFHSEITALLAGSVVQVVGAGAQGEFAGLDQVNIGPLPRTLAGRGESGLTIFVDGKQSNTVTVSIR